MRPHYDPATRASVHSDGRVTLESLCIGRVSKARRGWGAASATMLRPLDGFATRRAAVEYLLDVDRNDAEPTGWQAFRQDRGTMTPVGMSHKIKADAEHQAETVRGGRVFPVRDVWLDGEHPRIEVHTPFLGRCIYTGANADPLQTVEWLNITPRAPYILAGADPWNPAPVDKPRPAAPARKVRRDPSDVDLAIRGLVSVLDSIVAGDQLFDPKEDGEVEARDALLTQYDEALAQASVVIGEDLNDHAARQQFLADTAHWQE